MVSVLPQRYRCLLPVSRDDLTLLGPIDNYLDIKGGSRCVRQRLVQIPDSGILGNPPNSDDEVVQEGLFYNLNQYSGTTPDESFC